MSVRRRSIGGALVVGILATALGAGLYVRLRISPASEAYGRCVAYFEHPRPMFRTPTGAWAPHADLKLLVEHPRGPRYLARLDAAFDTVAYDAKQNLVYYVAIDPEGEPRLGKQGDPWKGLHFPECGNDPFYSLRPRTVRMEGETVVWTKR